MKKDKHNSVEFKRTEAKNTSAASKAKLKKTIIVVAVIIAVIVVAALIDHSIRHPRTKDETDAMNQIFGQGVISNNPEIEYETPVTINVLELETIDGKDYYPVEVIAGDEGSEKLYGPYYVRLSDSRIFLKDSTTGQLVPYGV